MADVIKGTVFISPSYPAVVGGANSQYSGTWTIQSVNPGGAGPVFAYTNAYLGIGAPGFTYLPPGNPDSIIIQLSGTFTGSSPDISIFIPDPSDVIGECYITITYKTIFGPVLAYAASITVYPAGGGPPDPPEEAPEPPALLVTPGPPRGACLGSVAPLSWAASEGATSYKVYRNGVLLESGVTELGYTDETVVIGVSYTFTVVASNMHGDSAPSAPIVITPCGIVIPPDPGSENGCTNWARGNADCGSTWTPNALPATDWTESAPCCSHEDSE